MDRVPRPCAAWASALGLLVASCGVRRGAPARVDGTAPPLPELYDVMVPKHASPGGPMTGQTSCGTRFVLRERQGASSRVTLGAETFWIDDADLARAPRAHARCPGPLMLRDARDEGGLARSLTPPVLTPVAPRDAKAPDLPRSVFRTAEDGRSCVELALGSAPGVEHVNDRTIVLRAALTRRELFLARWTEDVWDLVELDDEVNAEVWAYSPVSAERWYQGREACERSLPRLGAQNICCR